MHNIVDNFFHLSWISIFAIIYIAYFSTIFGFSAWTWLLNQYSASTIAPFTFLVPIFGMISSILILGESLHPWKIVAMLLVMLGLCINLFAKKMLQKCKLLYCAVISKY